MHSSCRCSKQILRRSMAVCASILACVALLAMRVDVEVLPVDAQMDSKVLCEPPSLPPSPACDNLHYNYLCEKKPMLLYVHCHSGTAHLRHLQTHLLATPSRPPHASIHLHPPPGIGNRYGCLLEHVVFARRYCAGRDLYVSMTDEYRPPQKCADCGFSRHFYDIEGVHVLEVSQVNLKCRQHVPLCDANDGRAPWLAPIYEKNRSRPVGHQCISMGDKPPSVMSDDIAKVPFYVGDLVRGYQALRPREHIAEPVANMSRRWQLREFGVGVHVRRTDRVPDESKRLKSDKRQLQQMSEALEREPRSVFYLAADNAASQRMFEEAFPGRVHFYARLEEHPDARRQTSTTHAFIDLFTLAECRWLIPSTVVLSTFGAMAEGLQCARSNGTVGQWCAGRQLSDRYLRGKRLRLFDMYEAALAANGERAYPER